MSGKKLIYLEDAIAKIVNTPSLVAHRVNDGMYGSAPDHTVLLTMLADRQFEIIDSIEEVPEADTVEVAHGKWIDIPPYYASNGNYNKAQECSMCHAFFVSPGNTPYSNHPYCCECGAKMDTSVIWREDIK